VLLGYDRFKKQGVFGVFCVALMIQSDHTECIHNLMGMFGEESIMEVLFRSVTGVDHKFSELREQLAQGPSVKAPDLLEPFEQQTRVNVHASNK
jgi:hypothetical protein